jgi:hypothetical protein
LQGSPPSASSSGDGWAGFLPSWGLPSPGK